MKLEETQAYRRRAAEWDPKNWDYTEWEECQMEAEQEMIKALPQQFDIYTEVEPHDLTKIKGYWVMFGTRVIKEFAPHQEYSARRLVRELNEVMIRYA